MTHGGEIDSGAAQAASDGSRGGSTLAEPLRAIADGVDADSSFAEKIVESVFSDAPTSAAPADKPEDGPAPEPSDAFALIMPDEMPAPIAATSTLPLVATVSARTNSLEIPSPPAKQDTDFADFGGIVVIPHPNSAREDPIDPSDWENEPADLPPEPAPPPTRGSAWTIPMLCAGLALIAACILIPLADENHQLVWQRQRLSLDLDQIHKQVSVNDEFLKRVADDPTLAERLARRQMRTIRQGSTVLDLSDPNDRADAVPAAAGDDGSMSPFMLVTVPAPAEMPPYEPLGGVLANFCRSPQRRLYTIGLGMLLIAAGLVLGHAPRLPAGAHDDDEAEESES